MSKGTVKVGSSGRFGPRYGVKTRMQIAEIERKMRQLHPCPRCGQLRVKRKSTSIWECRRCGLIFAGGAYQPKATPRLFVTAEKQAEAEDLQKEKAATKKGLKKEAQSGKPATKVEKAKKELKEPKSEKKDGKTAEEAPKKSKKKEE